MAVRPPSLARLAIAAMCESELSPVTKISSAPICSAIPRNTSENEDFSP
jgi:hypothetical protein